ncbi:MAG: hypothetical protein R2811_05710 [Flavobacteriales bacterium]
MSNGRFRQHLFALSGASGGEVLGSITYYALLRRAFRRTVSACSPVV